MTQENKELILKDLSARLPYGVKFPVECWNDELSQFNEQAFTLYSINTDLYCQASEGDGNIYNIYIEDVKPYLLPLSSMTEEQKQEYNYWKHEVPVCYYEYGDVVEKIELLDSPESFEYLIENHFDYRGLIPRDLALDATGLNIY